MWLGCQRGPVEVTQTQRRVIYTPMKLWRFLSDLAHSSLIWLGLGLVLTYFQPTQSQWYAEKLNCANMTVSDNPSGQTLSVCSSEPTSTDGPAVLKNSPPGFYCSVVWRTVTAQGACGLDMGTASSRSSHGLAQWDVSTPSERQDDWACPLLWQDTANQLRKLKMLMHTRHNVLNTIE